MRITLHDGSACTPGATYNDSRGSPSLDMRVTLHDASGGPCHRRGLSLHKKCVMSPQPILSQIIALLVEDPHCRLNRIATFMRC